MVKGMKMKKWLLTVVLGLSFSMAQANDDIKELCGSLGDFAGEIFEARQMGLSKSFADSVVKEAMSDVTGEEAPLVKELFDGVVQGVYELDMDDFKTDDPTEAAAYKYMFAGVFKETCIQEMK